MPRAELAAATRLDMVSVNVARAAGPALAGVVIARWGVAPVFALTAATAMFLAIVLLAWRRPRVTDGEREPFLPAMVTGGRYVRHEPVVQGILPGWVRARAIAIYLMVFLGSQASPPRSGGWSRSTSGSGSQWWLRRCWSPAARRRAWC